MIYGLMDDKRMPGAVTPVSIEDWGWESIRYLLA